jgi:hypothetical protein
VTSRNHGDWPTPVGRNITCPGTNRLLWSLEVQLRDDRARPRPTKENGETGFPISPLRTHLRQAFVALAAGRGWPQPPKGPRMASGMRDPRSLPPSTGHARSMRMDRSHRTPAPVSRHHSPLERGCGIPSKTTSTEHSRGPSAAFATARHLSVPLSARCSSFITTNTKLRETDFLPRHDPLQARESSPFGGLAG